MSTLNRRALGRGALRFGGALGLALVAFMVVSVGVSEWMERQSTPPSPLVIIVIPGLVALPVLLGSLWLPTRRWAVALQGFGVMMLGAAVLGVILGVALVGTGGTEEGGGLPSFWLLLLLGVLATGPILASIVPWWNRTDEAARQAHLSGFFWGGTAGALAVFPVLMVPVMQPGPSAALAGVDPDQAFFAGAVILYLAMSLGYGLFWAWWWLARSFGGRS